MGKVAKGREYRVKNVKKLLSPKDPRLKANQAKNTLAVAKQKVAEGARNVEQVPTSMFFAHNSALGPPCVAFCETLDRRPSLCEGPLPTRAYGSEASSPRRGHPD
jgi:U3 small nucleolar RNA-associated protein 24